MMLNGSRSFNNTTIEVDQGSDDADVSIMKLNESNMTADYGD